MNKIFITGCNGNLSRSIIKYLITNSNYKIIGCDLHDDFQRSEELMGYKIKYFKTNLSNTKSIQKLITSLKFQNLIPDILINNAAMDSVPDIEANNDGLDVEYFDDYFRINVRAPILLFKLLY